MEFLSRHVARLCMPDEVIFLESLPLGGTGKVQKSALRKQYGDIFQEEPCVAIPSEPRSS